MLANLNKWSKTVLEYLLQGYRHPVGHPNAGMCGGLWWDWNYKTQKAGWAACQPHGIRPPSPCTGPGFSRSLSPACPVLSARVFTGCSGHWLSNLLCRIPATLLPFLPSLGLTGWKKLGALLRMRLWLNLRQCCGWFDLLSRPLTFSLYQQ